MKGLLRADFYRLLKSKLSIVSLILAAVSPIFICALFLALKNIAGSADDVETASLANAFSSRAVIGTTFSFTNNLGIILPCFAAILVMADISNGTIRNKIVLGHSRQKVYASHFLSALAYILSLITIYALMTVLFSCLFLGTTSISHEHIKTIVFFYILGLLEFAMAAAAVICFSLSTMNNAAASISTIAFCLGLGLLVSILSAFIPKDAEIVCNFIPGFVLLSYGSREISLAMFLESLAGTLVIGAMLYFLGAYIFAKKNIK